MNFGVRLEHSDFIFESDWTVGLDSYLLLISASESALLAHIDQLRNLVREAAVYDWKGMYRN